MKRHCGASLKGSGSVYGYSQSPRIHPCSTLDPHSACTPAKIVIRVPLPPQYIHPTPTEGTPFRHAEIRNIVCGYSPDNHETLAGDTSVAHALL